MKKIKALAGWFWRMMRKFWPWYKGLYRGRAWYTKTGVAFVSLIVAFLLYLGAVDINFLWLFGRSPGYFRAFSTRKPTKPRKSIVPMAS